MAFTLDLTTMIVLGILVLVALYILLRFFGNAPADEEADEAEDGGITPVAPAVQRPPEMSDAEFIDSYTGPMLEDALDAMETAIGSIQAGIDHYKRPAWEAAGEEFHAAVKSLDEATAQLKDVLAMVEEPGSAPARKAKARIEECRRLRVLTITMEEACDMRVYGNEDGAKKLEAALPGLEAQAAAFTK